MNDYSYNVDMNDVEFVSKMDKFLKIVADETRLKIMFALLDENECHCTCEARHCSSCKCLSCMIELSVNQIVKKVDKSQSLISHQLKVLKDANFVSSLKVGRTIFYSLKDGHIKELLNIIKEHLEEE